MRSTAAPAGLETGLWAGRLLVPSQWHLVLPAAGFFAVAFVLPLGALLVQSVIAGQGKDAGAALSLEHYRRFLGDAFNLRTLGQTVRLGLEVTGWSLLLGYPVAYAYTRVGRRLQTLLLFCVISPLLTSAVVRSFAWIVILSRRGLVNTALLGLGLSAEPVDLLFTHRGVVIALTQIQLPLMVLPLIGVLERIDPNLEQAARSLGATRFAVFWRVTVPLSVPGIVAGGLLVFAGAISAFITQSLVGGGRLTYMPTYIYQQAVVLLNFSFAATVSLVLLATALGVVWLGERLGRRYRLDRARR